MHVSKTVLSKIMRKKGFSIIKIPSGNGIMRRYIRQKVPYSSLISEDTLLEIIQEVIDSHGKD